MSKNVSEAQWIDLDRAMRRIVTQLIDPDYLKIWKDTSGGIQ
jgi:hypothetical protein